MHPKETILVVIPVVNNSLNEIDSSCYRLFRQFSFKTLPNIIYRIHIRRVFRQWRTEDLLTEFFFTDFVAPFGYYH